MPVAPIQDRGLSLLLVEGGLTGIAVALAFCWPGAGSRGFKSIEETFSRLARRKTASIAVVGFSALLLRLALLPVCPVPKPFIHDDFSFLLAANTFASGRLTNPTPAMWMHLESFHIDMKPTYMSMYFPAQGLLLAAGKLVTGQAWYGLLAVTALMCAAICWMLQAWLPPSWALLGGLLAVLRLGLFSYWINMYVGAGSVAALGGALVLGALPRLMKRPRVAYGVLLALGLSLLALSRPYEGVLLALPVLAALLWWMVRGKNRPPAWKLARLAVLPVLLVVSTVVWLGYYDHVVFGNATTLPYKVNRSTYAMAPYFVWQSPRSHPYYRHVEMRDFYQIELTCFENFRSVPGYLEQSFLIKPLRALLFFAGIALLPPLLMLWPALADKRIRFLVLCLPLLIAGMLIELWLIPHYLAPFTVVFYAIGLAAMRHLRVWRPNGQPVGMTLVRYSVSLCLVVGVLRVFAAPLHLSLTPRPETDWATSWYGPSGLGDERAAVESRLERLPGKQLVIVNYAPNHDCLDEWVYNAPDPARSKVIWARDMGAAQNQQLVDYYKNRTVWVVEPDDSPVRITRYSPDMDTAQVIPISASQAAESSREVPR